MVDTDPARFASFARKVMGVTETEDKAAALAGIAAFEDHLRSLGMPVTVTELLGRRLGEQESLDLAHGCSFQGTRTIGTLRVLDEADIAEVYRRAL